MEFDKDNAESPFLNFVSEEFYKRGSDLRRLMSDKANAPDLVAGWGLRSAARKHLIRDLNELNEELLGDRCAFKYGKGWSAKGVYLLERVGKGRYLDQKSLQVFTLDGLRKAQAQVLKYYKHENPYWLIEEFHRGALSNAEIPYDYKIYTFQGIIGFIISVDRNASPPRIAIYDGNLKPFIVDEDYLCPSPNVQQGNHILPKHILEHLWWARELSLKTDSPFVRIDMYDTDKGPAFGEYTFSPGDMHKRMFRLKRPFVSAMDQLFLNSEQRLASGNANEKPADLQNYSLQTLLWDMSLAQVQALPMVSDRLYRRYADVAANNGANGYDRMAKRYFYYKKNAKSELESKIFEELRKAWRGLHETYHSVAPDEIR